MKSKIFLSVSLSILIIIVSKDLLSELYYGKTKNKGSKESTRYDYAALESGGKILEHSHQIFGAKGILREDKDKYLLVPCEVPEKWIEISLLEYILIDEVQFIQGEIYSSPFKEVEIYYSAQYPSDTWELLANVTLLPILNPQKFQVINRWVRFLKIIFKSHYDNEHYCTLTQFSVYGNSILQELDEEYYKARREEFSDLLQGIKDFDYPENNLRHIFKKQTEQLNQIELFYDNAPLTDEDICIDRFYFEYSFGKDKFIAHDEIKGERIKNPQVDIFQAMIKHMAKTEAFLTLHNRYIMFLLDLANNNANESRETKIKLDAEILSRIKSEKLNLKRLSLLEEKNNQSEIQAIQYNIALKEIQESQYKIEQSIIYIKFWIFFVIFLNFIAVVFVIYEKPLSIKQNTMAESQFKIRTHKRKRLSTNYSGISSF